MIDSGIIALIFLFSIMGYCIRTIFKDEKNEIEKLPTKEEGGENETRV